MKRLIQSFCFAFDGVRVIVREQPNFRIHILALIVVSILGYFFEISKMEWLAVALVSGLVFTAEAFNSALESAVDLSSPNVHPLAKKAKDMAAAAVLLASITAVFVGAIVFGKRFLLLFN
ncbi:MAG: diacylglycerol kinase family protein [Chitinophagales bacterium]|nr:diacylglycerol kinase family protein [Chitinophagales bacterium]MDW8273867.1 diacylglycerol kinase family protein [Chitinophagales bacterium]